MPYQVPPTSAPEAAPVVYDDAMIAQALDFAANRYGVDKAQIAEFASALPDMGDPIRNIMMAGNNLKKGNAKMVTPDNTAALDPKKNAYGANATRTAGDVASDSFKSVAQAGVSLTGLLAGAAATVGVPNADKVVDATNYARDAIGKTKSLKAQADQAILSQAAEGKNEDGSDKGFLENAADTAAVLLDKPYMILDLGLQNSATLIAGAALGLGGAGTTALVGFQAALGAGDGYSSARERVMAMPTNELAQNSKAYNAFVAGGMTPEQAKLAVADSTAKAAGQTMGVVSGLIGKFGGVALEKSLGTVAAGGAVTGKMAAANAAKEIVTEGIEEGSNQLVGNTSIKIFANENQGFMQGVGGAATMGAAAAAPTSGAMAGGTYIASDRQAKINAEIEKARGKAVDVVTKADAALAMPSVGAASQAIDEAIKVKTANELANTDTELQAALGTIEMYDAKSGEFLGATSNEATAVQPQAPATEAVEQLIPSPQDTAYGRLEQKRIDANNMMRGITPAVPEVEIEAAYRQAEQLREQQKQAELVELELQSLEAEREQLLKLQGETPVTNTAMAEQLRSQLMNNEIKRLLIIDERKKAQETNPRLVEAGIEEMQGVEMPELPMPITEDLATAPIALPENFADERLADTAYRAVLGDVMDQSMKGGGVQLIAQQGTGYTGGDGNEYGQQVTRTKSMNHPITQALVADGYKAEEVRNALDAALKGQKLGKRWQGLVAKALDYSNTDAADIKAQMGEFEQAKAADIAPENLGYGDAVNAPFAPDNAQPVTMREQAMPRGAEGGVKFSVGGNTNGDELMALFMQSVDDALSGNKSEAQIKQDQQKALRDGLPVKIDSYIERQKSMLADWGSREYKQNNSRIEFTGDTPMKAESMSIGQINESRKRKTIQSLQENIAAAAKLKDGLSYLNLQGAVEEYYRMAGEVIKANPNEADYGGIDGYVERMISQRVLGQKKGEYGSNSLAAVIREAYKPIVDGNGVKFSVGANRRVKPENALSVTHNISEEGLLFADSLGGLPVPSLAVLKDGLSIDGYGDITLIGTKDLADPAINPVWDADAYTTRFPDVEYDKPKLKEADKLVDSFRDSIKQFSNNGDSYTSEIFEQLHNRANPAEAVFKLTKQAGVKAQYLNEVHGVSINPVLAPVALRYNAISTDAKVRSFIKNMDEFYSDYGAYSEESLAIRKAFTPIYIDALRKEYEAKGLDNQTLEIIVNSSIQKSTDENGVVSFMVFDRILADQKKIGKKEVDAVATEKRIQTKLKGKEADFKTWVEKKVYSIYGEPFITVGRKKVPFTLNNIVDSMLHGGVHAKEETMTFGDGKARAAAARKFTRLETMRQFAVDGIADSETVAKSQKESGEAVAKYREALVPYYKYKNWRNEVDVFGAMDDAMRALADWAAGRIKLGSEQAFKKALSKNGFVGVPKEIVKIGIDAGELFLNSPVPYFESKPHRAVAINEFAGAVVPSDVSNDVIAVLEKNGLTVTRYNKNKDGARANAVNKLRDSLFKSGSDVLFSFAGQKAKTANLENLATAEQMLADGVDADTVWKQTGWEKGADGQWKFEIDDSGAVLARNYVSIVRNKGYAPLSKVLKHESLFAAYPALNDVKVSLVARGNKLGSYSSERNVIDINLGLSKQEYLSTLLHEIQHAIQQEENFARGGSSSVITPEQREAALIELEHEAANMGLPSYESKVKDFLTGKITQEEYEDYLWDIASATKENGMAGYKFELYQRLAGETEARNTQARLTLGAEARRNTPPQMTEDVARDKQIVRFEGGQAEMAVDSSEISADKNDWRAVRKEVLDKVRERYQGKPEVFKTKNGDSVIVTWSGLKHALNHGVPTWQDSVIALHINELISNAELDSVAPDKNGRSNPHSAGVYYSNVVIDGVKYRAVMHTRIGSEGEKHYDHTVLVRESQAGQRGGVTEESALTTLPLGLANENITTPKSEVNTLKQELAKSKDAQRLMNSGKVEVVQSESELPNDIENAITKSDANGKVQGLFDPATNKTYLIADNLSTADAMGVLTHEVGVHAWFASANGEKKAALEKRAVGLLKTRKLAGGELRTFLDLVQQRMVDAEQVNDNGTYKDNEEAVAYIVEEAINQFADSRYLLNDNKLLDTIGKASKSLANFIADVITYLKSGMHKLGWMDTQKLTAGDLVAIAKGNMREVAQNDVGVNDGMAAGDVAYSKQGKQGKDIYGFMDNIQAGLEQVNDIDANGGDSTGLYNKVRSNFVNQLASAGVNRQWLNQNADSVLGDMMASEGAWINYGEIAALANGISTGSNSSNVGNPNSNLGNQAPDLPDSVIPEWTRKDAIIANEVDRMQRVKQLQRMVEKAVGKDNTPDLYGAAQRYAAIAPTRVLDMSRAAEGIVKAMAKDNITPSDIGLYMYAVHAPERNAYIMDKNEVENGSGMSDEQAADIRDALKDMHANIDTHAQAWRKLIDATLDIRVQNGAISQESAAEWREKMPNYVPLKNHIESSEQVTDETNIVPMTGFMGTGKKFNLTGKEIREAKGRTTQAGNIIENVVFDMQRGLVRAEKNNVLIELARMVSRHKEATTADGRQLWTFLRERPESMVGVVEFFVNGKRHYVQINDQLMHDALAGLDADAFTAVDKAVQFIKKTITAWNPAFTIVNALRDSETAIVNGSQELGVAGAAKMAVYFPKAMASAWRYERGGNDAARLEWDKWHERYRLAGGKTGYLDARNLEQTQKRIDELFKIHQKGITKENFAAKSLNAGAQALKFIEDMGSATENMWRLAAFRVAVEQGKSVQEAARIAKNLTVNFDRKGSSVRSRERWFLFYNAAMQGVVRMGQTVTSKGALAIAGSLIAAGFAAGMQDWEDEEGNNLFDLLPEHEKMRTIPIIGTADGKRLNVPMAYGLGYFTYMGMKLAQAIRYQQTDGRQGEDVSKTLGHLVNGFALHNNPFGGQQLAESLRGEQDQAIMMLAPVLSDPLIQIFMNKNAFGSSLYPDSPFGVSAPASEKVFEFQKGNIYDIAAKWMSRTTGGDGVDGGAIEVPPAALEALVRGFTGGAGQFVEKNVTLAVKSINGESDKIEARDIPVFSTVYKQGQDKLYYDAWQEVVKDVEEAAAKLKRYDKGLADDGATPDKAASDWRLGLEQDVKNAKKALQQNKTETTEVSREYRTEDDKDRRAQLKAEIERLKAEKMAIQSEVIKAYKDERAKQ